MTEILLSNFEEQFTALEASLRKAVFVAMDTEFSGLRSSKVTPSLFDNNKARYLKMKDHIEDFIIIQYGLAAFHYHEATNTYTADVYNIYLFPRSFGSVDRSFKFQASSVEFLCRYDFNFNKMTYEGLPYVTMQQEAELRSELLSGALLPKVLASCDLDMQDLVKLTCSRVAKWQSKATEKESLVVDCPKEVPPFLLHYEIRLAFPTLWTEKVDGGNKQVRVVKVGAEQRASLEAQPGSSWPGEEALQHSLGFSRVFAVLASLSVPIIGHNVLLDLMMSFQQFVEPLPNCYDEFKAKMHNVFGTVIDTKYLSLEVKQLVSHETLWDSSLPGVFSFLSSKQCDVIAPNPPTIKTDAYDIPTGADPPAMIEPAVKGKPRVNHTKSNLNGFTKRDLETINEMEDAPSTSSTNKLSDAVNVMVNGNEMVNGKASPEVVGDKKGTLGAHFHEAAWDSFCSGYVFLRFAHILAHKQRPKTVETGEEGKEKPPPPPLSWECLLEAVKPFENRIHITLGQVTHMYLKGSDLVSHRPPMLHVQSRDSAPLNLSMVQEVLSRFGSIDIKPYSLHKAYIAAPNVGCVRDILRYFKTNPQLKVEMYSPIRHSPVVRTLLWAGAVAFTSGGAYLIASLVWRK